MPESLASGAQLSRRVVTESGAKRNDTTDGAERLKKIKIIGPDSSVGRAED